MGKFTVRFTGVITTVFDTYDGPTQAVALIPNLAAPSDSEALAVPATTIRRDVTGRALSNHAHMAFLRYPSIAAEPIVGAPGTLPPATFLRYLNRHRVRFSFEGTPEPETLQANSDPAAPGRQWESYIYSDLTEAQRTDLSNLVDISEIAGRAIDTAYLDARPDDTILAQVMIDGPGTLRAEEPAQNVGWILNSLARPESITRPLSDSMSWTVEGVDRVEVQFEPLDELLNAGNEERSVSFDLGAGDLEITIANLCVENPLEWAVNHELVRDRDLLWSLPLLDEPNNIAEEARLASLRAKDLAPFPVRSEAGGSSGSNCKKGKARAKDNAVAALFRSLDD